MISFLRGTVRAKDAQGVILDVGGWGLRLVPTARALSRVPAVGGELELPVHLVVREDGWQLFGLADRQEQVLFELLLQVNGIGPRLALAVVSTLEPGELQRAVLAEDPLPLTTVPGVGRKTAQRLVLELKDRLRQLPGAAAAGGVVAPRPGTPWQEAWQALVVLGYSEVEAQAGLKEAARVLEGEEPSTEHLLRVALRVLRPQGSR